MAFDAKAIVNLGLGKISASRVSSLGTPKSNLEKHNADGYDTWRDEELAKRNWSFALAYKALTSETYPDAEYALDGRKTKFALPNDCIKPIRDRHATWEQRGRFLWDYGTTLTVPYIKRANEAEFDPLFRDVLACRIAKENVEYVTQSSQKGMSADQQYDKAVTVAGRQNAFVVGPEDQQLDDDNDEWLQARLGRCT